MDEKSSLLEFRNTSYDSTVNPYNSFHCDNQAHSMDFCVHLLILHGLRSNWRILGKIPGYSHGCCPSFNRLCFYVNIVVLIIYCWKTSISTNEFRLSQGRMGALLYFGGHTHSHGGGGHNHAHSYNEEEESVEKGQNINVRAAFIHVLGDLIQSAGVFCAEDWAIVDPICTLIFSVIVLCTTIYILRDAMVVLLEGRPNTIDFSKVFASLEKISGVQKVHDLRIWALTMDKVAVSVHLEVDDLLNAQSVLRDTRIMLKKVYGVHESTVQIEGFVAEKDCGRCDIPK
uniref:ZT_dimer domain-containing protein n=1 Tax=Heterorhabditis bacteriophora TaxID=37862 RepID=A0A1I7X4Q1_HETBA